MRDDLKDAGIDDERDDTGADPGLEALLARHVEPHREEPSLPEDFTARVMAARGFAPWEVRRPSAWRVPAAAAGLLLAASLVLALTPLFRLGPVTAVVAWSELVLFSFARPAEALFAAAPLLAGAVHRAAALVPASVLLTVFGLTAASGAALALGLFGRSGRSGSSGLSVLRQRRERRSAGGGDAGRG